MPAPTAPPCTCARFPTLPPYLRCASQLIFTPLRPFRTCQRRGKAAAGFADSWSFASLYFRGLLRCLSFLNFDFFFFWLPVFQSEGSPTASIISSALWKESVSKRPPYSYMAMIQFAINSTEKKRMMLKDIYTWIEDNFPYFKHVAKPGWKNSVRHNLSLHDMFVRETSANGKIAFWTIHPEANRYLTLDQVFKQQKRPTLDLQKNLKVTKVDFSFLGPRIKPLLPRVSSYLVPVHFPASQPFHLQLPSRLPLPACPTALGTTQINTVEHPAPKVSLPRLIFLGCVFLWIGESNSSPALLSFFLSTLVLQILRSSEDPVLSPPPSSIKEEQYCGEESSSLTLRIGQIQKETALSPLFLEEPVLLLPLGGGSTSFPMGHCPSTQEEPLGTLVCGPEEEPPVTGRLPIASTPNKIPINTSSPPSPTDQWRLTPLVNETSKVDFSSPRSSPLPFLSFQDNLDLEFNETPLRQSLGDSLQGPLLNADTGEIVAGLLNSSSPSSKVACEIAGDNSLLEDLVLDNMPENWSKLSLDISFPDTGNDNLETDLSWSQLLPQLK
uniref:Forkhead box protein M1 n=1 Tax=Naja naja TaxID=35670 RepID=A0A8C6XV39_NAJNA